MAISSDVMRALKDRIITATAPFAAANPTKPRTVMLGWPSHNQFQDCMNKGRTFISIYPVPGSKDITMYQPYAQVLVPCSRSAYIVDIEDLTDQTKHREQVRLVVNQEAEFHVELKTVEIAETAELNPGDTFAVCIGPPVADPGVSYVIQEGDTIETALAALVSLFNDTTTGIVVEHPWLLAVQNERSIFIRFLPGIPAVPGPDGLPAPEIEYVTFILGGQVTIGTEVKRQVDPYWVNIWSPSAEIRDEYAEILETDFASFSNPATPGVSNRLMLSDGTCALVLRKGYFMSDDEQLQNVWRYTIILSAEYATVVVSQASEVICTDVCITPNQVSEYPTTSPHLKFRTQWGCTQLTKSVAEQLNALLATSQTGCKI